MQFIVVDLEANPGDFKEIINIAAHKVNIDYKILKEKTNNYVISSKKILSNNNFDVFVKPFFNGRLSKKMSKLLKIDSKSLEDARLFDIEMANFQKWSNENNEDTVFITWSKTDSLMIKSNCKKYFINYNWFCNQYFDLQKCYDMMHKKMKPTGLCNALKENNINFIGQPHKAIDDSYNTTQILLNC